MDLLEAIMPVKTIIACHNKYDVMFANEINLKNKRCFFWRKTATTIIHTRIC